MKFLKQAKYNSQYHLIHVHDNFCSVAFLDEPEHRDITVSFEYHSDEHMIDINIANKMLFELDLDSNNVKLKKAEAELFEVVSSDGLNEIIINNPKHIVHIAYTKNEREFNVTIRKTNCNYAVDLVLDISE